MQRLLNVMGVDMTFHLNATCLSETILIQNCLPASQHLWYSYFIVGGDAIWEVPDIKPLWKCVTHFMLLVWNEQITVKKLKKYEIKMVADWSYNANLHQIIYDKALMIILIYF